jgi:hypothetical protein
VITSKFGRCDLAQHEDPWLAFQTFLVHFMLRAAVVLVEVLFTVFLTPS